MTLRLPLALALAVLAVSACKKDGHDEAPTNATTEPSAEEAARPAEQPSPKADTPDPGAKSDADYVRVFARHAPAKPDDPVTIEIETFEVKDARFDPDDPATASAVIALDLSSIRSGIDKRDGHLKSPDYLDVAQFATATVAVKDVKKAGDGYQGTAVVAFHGAETSFPVSFEVVEGGEDGVRVKSRHAFKRSDFSIGKDQGDPAADELEIEMLITIPRS